MPKRKALLYIWVALGLGLLLAGAGYPAVFFEMRDPSGDENGYGSYQYPTNIAFKPYKGLFDITGFKVWSEKPGIIYFDTGFAAITNPWAAPEGFIHQNLRIFIDSRPGEGFVNLPQRGANVSFDPKYAWDIGLKLVGWENSQLFLAKGNQIKMWPLKTEVLGDGLTIRAQVATARIGYPEKRWNYYVFVGSYDGFGTDFFRKVMRKQGEWVIGGGLDELIEPNIMDLLAPPQGAGNQIKQLSSFNRETGELARLEPVGGGVATTSWLACAGWAVLILLALTVTVMVWVKPKRISCFWIRRSKTPKASSILSE
jgi:carbohydrate-binding DOMON domain-containing protein